MEQQTPSRGELIIAGLGGQGILMAGMILARAATTAFNHASWVPSYATRVRGGPSECTVVYANAPINSPVLSESGAVVIVDPPSLRLYENRVRPGGVLIIESAGLNIEVTRKDIRALPIPALDLAMSVGEQRAVSLVLLGAYVEATRSIAPQVVEEELERRFAAKGQILAFDRIQSTNTEAFRQGMRAVAEHSG